MAKKEESFDDVEYKGDLSPKYYQVPFVDEVQEFNEVMGKPNNYEPIIPIISLTSKTPIAIYKLKGNNI